MSDELSLIRHELWDLLAELKSGELEPEVVDTAISALDSLLESVRLERLERSLKRTRSDEDHDAVGRQT